MTGQTNGVCAKGIRFNNASSRGEVFGMDLADQIRTREGELLKALVDGDPPLYKKRSNGTITTERMIFDFLQESHRKPVPLYRGNLVRRTTRTKGAKRLRVRLIRRFRAPQ
jgi:hypothetical protein